VVSWALARLGRASAARASNMGSLYFMGGGPWFIF
jgi:hypothetical protein